jgi:hypothetical protein
LHQESRIECARVFANIELEEERKMLHDDERIEMFSGLFQDINISRNDETIPVPLCYCDRESFLAKSAELPQMSFVMEQPTDGSTFPFKLWIYAHEMEDACRIVEQILPFFTPSFTPLEKEANISIRFTDATIAALGEGLEGEENDPYIAWVLGFTMTALTEEAGKPN